MTRIAFLGQGPIASACVDALVNDEMLRAKVEVPIAATTPSILERLQSHPSSTPLLIFGVETREDAGLAKALMAERVDWLISVQYPWILSAAVLTSPRLGALNLHNARLPDYRGHNSLSHEILNGEKDHTVTIHWMEEIVDTGYYAYEHTIPIREAETSFSLYQKALAAAPTLFITMLSDIAAGRPLAKRPIVGEGKYYRKRDIVELKRIVDHRNIEEVDRKARAFYFPPHEPAFVEIDGRKTHLVPDGVAIPPGTSWKTITAFRSH